MAKPTSETIKLFAYGSGWGIPFRTAAPFPLKLATWMKMANIPFEFVTENDASKGPKGKSPWIEVGGERVGDSSIIIERLTERFGVDLDAHLGAHERAIAVSVQRMLEEHFHQCFEHQLFFGRGGRERLQELADTMPIPIRWLLPAVASRAFAKQLHARGMGRHSEEVIIGQAKADLDALSELLGDGPYMFGDTPSSLDACVFGFLGVSVYVSGDNPLYRYAASRENLLRYCERMRARYFPETLETLAPLVSSERAADPAPSHDVALRPNERRTREANGSIAVAS